MNKPLEVYQPHAEHEESIERIAKRLGRNKLRRLVFNLIYGRGTKPRTVAIIIEQLSVKPNQFQPVRNQVVYLAKHKIILEVAVEPSKNDGARLAYGKVEFVAANKEEILKYADKPSRLKSLPTKRRPFVSQSLGIPRAVRKVLEARRNGPVAKLKVLYVQANPSSQQALRTDAEYRMVLEAVRGSKYRQHIELISVPAADAKAILNGINDHRPQVVHFSGHGGGGSIWLDDGKVNNSKGRAMSFDLLAQTLSATDSPPLLIVLNACDTAAKATPLLSASKIVVAMADAISDFGAATFAAQFYAALASAQPISVALDQGVLAMKFASLSDANLPKLIHRRDVNPKKLALTGGR